MADLSEVFTLSPAERIRLAEDLWDSVAAQPEDLPALTEPQWREFERRLADHAKNPALASSWEDVRTRLWRQIS